MSESLRKKFSIFLPYPAAYIDLSVVRLWYVHNNNVAKLNIKTLQNLNNIATKITQNLLLFYFNIILSVFLLRVWKDFGGIV